MSREIRKVPKDWEHPKKGDGSYKAMHEYDEEHNCNCEYCEVNSEEDYMPKVESEYGYALYETVGAGTPITPVFPTKEELRDYLVANGDFWHYSWTLASAQRMIDDGWAPSGVMIGGKYYRSNEIGEIPANN